MLLGIVILAACGGQSNLQPLYEPNFETNLPQEPQDNDEEQDEAPALAPTHGGHINIAMPMPQTLNPLLNSDPHLAQVLRLIFEPLVVFDQNNSPISNPAIIESIVFAPSGQSLTVTLRENIFWEDGMPITSTDIQFSINILRWNAPQTAVYRQNVENITSTNISDTRTLHINLSAPNWQMMYSLDFPIIPSHYYTGVSTTNLTAPRNMHPIGNGPFRFHSYVAASHLGLMSNDNAPGGTPYIQFITATILRDIADADHAFSRGLIDVFVASQSEAGRMRALGKNPAAVLPPHNLDFIAFNRNNSIFDDFSLRYAIGNPTTENFAVLEYIPQELTIIANEQNIQAVMYAQNLYSQLLNHGIESILYILPPEIFSSQINSGNFDLAVATIYLQNPENWDFLQIFGNTPLPLDDLPIIELGRRGNILFTSTRLHGDFSPTNTHIFHGVQNWFLIY